MKTLIEGLRLRPVVPPPGPPPERERSSRAEGGTYRVGIRPGR